MTLPDLNPILELLELDPVSRGLQILAAQELAADSFPRIDTDRPALVFQLDSATIAKVVRTLSVNYPVSHALTLVEKGRVSSSKLGTLLHRTRIARDTILYLPPLAYAGSPLTLANIMARLRAPEGGCPWDLEQTHESITRALVEETYEVLEAISESDSAQLKEELGDLFLHVLFQTQIARDENEFALSDVGAELAAKLIRRHPHVFGTERAQDTSWVLENWERIKQEEKRRKGKSSNGHALDAGIPRHLPALTRSQKVWERVQRRQEKSNEKHSALERSRGPASGVKRRAKILDFGARISRASDRERAVGETLLEISRIAQEHGVDAERALYRATKRLVQKKESNERR